MIVSRGFAAIDTPLFYVLMITSAAHDAWPDDISLVDDFADYGLSRPSMIRVTKIESVVGGDAAVLGRLHGSKLRLVEESMRTALTPPAAPAY